MTNYLTRDAILNAADTPEQDVPVPQWGGSVRIKAMTKAEHQALRAQATTIKPGATLGETVKEIDDQKFETLLVIHSVIEPKFAPDEAELLRGKSAGAIDTIIKAITALNGWTKEAVTAAERSFPPRTDEASGVPASA